MYGAAVADRPRSYRKLRIGLFHLLSKGSDVQPEIIAELGLGDLAHNHGDVIVRQLACGARLTVNPIMSAHWKKAMKLSFSSKNHRGCSPGFSLAARMDKATSGV